MYAVPLNPGLVILVPAANDVPVNVCPVNAPPLNPVLAVIVVPLNVEPWKVPPLNAPPLNPGAITAEVKVRPPKVPWFA